MKRIISIILCIAMLGSCAVLLSSCAKKTVDLSEYSIVYRTKNITNSFGDNIYAFSKTLSEYCGASLRTNVEFSDDTVESDDPEILIGNTNRVETGEALSKIEGDGYYIGVIGKKLVVVGTSNLMTEKAMDYFRETYLSGESSGKSRFSVKRKIESNVPVIELDGSFTVTYQKGLDNVEGSPFGNEENRVTSDNPHSYDYPVVAADQIRSVIAETCGVTDSEIQSATDRTDAPECEIQVGLVNRTEMQEFLSEFDVNNYGYAVKGNKIVVTALSDAMLRFAVSDFKDMLFDATVTKGNDGSSIHLPTDLSVIKTSRSNWVTEFPRPTAENILLTGSVDLYDNSVEFHYTGEGVSLSAFSGYCASLEAAGYTIYTQNQIDKNVFKTYVNDDNVLNVSYEPFTYASEQRLSSIYEPCIRIVSAKRTSVNLLPQKLLTPDYSYTKITDTQFTAMRLDYANDNWGNCYVITLEDGSFIVCDGGGSKSTADCTRLYNVLCDLYERAHGYEVGGDTIIIRAWYLSHLHMDHYGNFTKFLTQYGKNVKVEYMIANFASDSECYNSYDANQEVRNSIASISSRPVGGMKYIKVHAGQKFYFCNVELEVLYTHENIYPNRIVLFNDTSTVIRFTVRNTNGSGQVQGTPFTSINLGDLYDYGSKYLRAMYGNKLKSDAVQVAHHGSMGCEYELYALAAPTILWWPTNLALFNTMIADQNSPVWFFKVDWKLANLLKSLRYIVVSDGYNTTVTIGKDGPDMRVSALFSAAEPGVSVKMGKYILERNNE